MLAAGEERVERGLLEGGADVRPDLGPVVHDVEAGDAGRAGGRRQQGGQHVDGRGLARAVGAEEAVDLAGRDRQVDPVDGARPLLELAHELLGLDSWLGCH